MVIFFIARYIGIMIMGSMKNPHNYCSTPITQLTGTFGEGRILIKPRQKTSQPFFPSGIPPVTGVM